MDNKSVLANPVVSNIPKLRNILKEKHTIDVPSQCDKFLERCLRQKDGNTDKAAKLLQAIHQVILDFQHSNATLDPTCYDATFYNPLLVCPLAARDKLGRRVFVGQITLWNPENISFEKVGTATRMVTLVAITNAEDQKHGHVVIWNLEGFTMQQAYSLRPRKFFEMCKWSHSGVMGRVKAVHFVNHPKVVGLIYDGVKRFLSAKMQKRIKFHKNLTELQKSLDLDKKALPKLCGGNLEVEECMDTEFMKDLLSSADFFQDMLNIGFPVK